MQIEIFRFRLSMTKSSATKQNLISPNLSRLDNQAKPTQKQAKTKPICESLRFSR